MSRRQNEAANHPRRISQSGRISESVSNLSMSASARSADFSSMACRAHSTKLRFEFIFGHRIFRPAFGVLRLAGKGLAIFEANRHPARPARRIGLLQIGIQFHLHSLGELQNVLIPHRAVGENIQPDFAVDDRSRDQIRHAELSLDTGLRHAKDNVARRYA